MNTAFISSYHCNCPAKNVSSRAGNFINKSVSITKTCKWRQINFWGRLEEPRHEPSPLCNHRYYQIHVCELWIIGLFLI